MAVAQSEVAVVMPVFRHSAIVADAIASLVDQSGFARTHLVIVDDGCPHAQTILTCAPLAGQLRNIHYIRQINRGLSGARNCGVDFVLAHLPACEAIYFLDADNRLQPHALSRFFELLASDAAPDWFYPDIEMFGMEWVGDYSGPFNRLTECLVNICEAGSLVRRRVFESGLRFDEQMRLGYEDWEFWLSAIERGFSGKHMPGSGFQYRKRAESMLADSTRLHDEIVRYIETKHPWLRDPLALVAFEHEDAPRYATVLTDEGIVTLGSDPARGVAMSLTAYGERLRKSVAAPSWFAAGAYVVFASRAVLDALNGAGLLHFAYWEVERQLDGNNFVFLNIESSASNTIEIVPSAGARPERADLVALKMTLLRAVLADKSDSWIQNIEWAPATIAVQQIVLRAPSFGDLEERWQRQNRDAYEFVRRERQWPHAPLWHARFEGRSEGTIDLAQLPAKLRWRFRRGVMPNIVAQRERRAVFVVPIFEFGGVERVAFNVAREMRASGYDIDLIVVGRANLKMYDDFGKVFSRVFLLHGDTFNAFTGRSYYGTALAQDVFKTGRPDIVNLLCSYGVVINCHAADVLNAADAIRKSGVIVVNYVHLLEYTDKGRMVGHPVLGMAFEHAIDIMACCSRRLGLELGALGIPHEKIVVVPNGPGITIPSVAIAQSLSERKARRTERLPLRVLYLGRLDAQKGVDRLRAIVAGARAQTPEAEFRIVGARVIDAALEESTDILTAMTEPPRYADRDIAELYAWADVLIMPSRYEGLPLAIIEAMTLGVVPVATDVGAVAEVVSHGETGFLVSSDRAAAETLVHLARLGEDRDLLAALSRNAIEAAAARRWPDAVSGLLAAVRRVERARKGRRAKPAWLPPLAAGSDHPTPAAS